MQITIQSVHFKASQQLEEFVQEKVEHLSRTNAQIISADVYLKLDNAETGENKVCEIKVLIPGKDLFAKRQCKTFEEATVEAVDALKDQLARKKE